MSEVKRNIAEISTVGDSDDLLLGIFETGAEGVGDSSDHGAGNGNDSANADWTINDTRLVDTITMCTKTVFT